MRPIAACAEIVELRTRVVRSHRNRPAFPAQWFYGLLRALPGDRLFVTVTPEKPASRGLDASTEASEPHDFAVRELSAFVSGAACVHRILSRVRNDLEPPLCGTGQGGL